MPSEKLTIEVDGRGGWKVSEQQGKGEFELKVKDNGAERDPNKVTYKPKDVKVIVDP